MIPGGYDFVCARNPTGEKLRRLLDFFSKQWSEGLLQFDDDLDPVPITDLTPEAFGGLREFFIYQNQDSHISWETEGATRSNGETMIHVLLEVGAFCFVAGSEDGPSGRMVKNLCRILYET